MDDHERARIMRLAAGACESAGQDAFGKRLRGLATSPLDEQLAVLTLLERVPGLSLPMFRMAALAKKTLTGEPGKRAEFERLTAQITGLE